MSLRLCSFGVSFLLPSSSRRPASVRRAVRLLLAARRRWPDGRLALLRHSLCWVVPRGVYPAGAELVGVMVEWRRGRVAYFWAALAPGGAEYELWGQPSFLQRVYWTARLALFPSGYWGA